MQISFEEIYNVNVNICKPSIIYNKKKTLNKAKMSHLYNYNKGEWLIFCGYPHPASCFFCYILLK